MTECVPDPDPQFCMARGLPFRLVYQFELDFDLTTIDSATFTVNDTLDSVTPVLTAPAVVDELGHRAIVNLTDAQTTGLQAGSLYWFDLVLESAGQPVSGVYPGRFSVSPMLGV